MAKTKKGEKEKKPRSKGHDGVGLKGEKEFPKEMRSFKIVDESQDSHQHRKRSDIGTDSRNRFIPFSPDEISGGRDDKSPFAQPCGEKIDRHNPVPMNMYHSFHVLPR